MRSLSLGLFGCFCLFLQTVVGKPVVVKPLGDKASISLLTASPGNEVYEQYGHTALRVCDPDTNKLDVVFGYGYFDFNSPHFLWRFLRGKTDYMVGTCSYWDFILEYQIDNRAVTEQVLNLTQKEKERIWQALIKNIRKKNRTYRYNFFYDNCSTRPRDIVLKNIDGNIDLRYKGSYKSFRDEVHFYTQRHPWTQFGIDFVIGSKADAPISTSMQQFAPEVLMESFSKAVIRSDSSQTRPLVLETRHPASIDQNAIEKTNEFPKPICVTTGILLLVTGLSLYGFKKKKPLYLLDGILFGLAGLPGAVIAFMVCFSEHPTTDVNFLLLWLHPFHLIYAFSLLFKTFRKKAAGIYLSIHLPLMLLSLLGGGGALQCLHTAMYPLLFSMMLRSGTAWYFILKNRRHA